MFRIYNSFAKCNHCSICGNPAAILDTNTTSLNEAEIVFVGENPGKVEIHRMLPFTGQCGVYLRRVIKVLLEKYKWIITNTVLCSTIENGFTSNPTKENICDCSLNVMNLIKIADPTLVVLLGRSAVMGLLAKDIANKNMSSIVGQLFEMRGICDKYIACAEYHPRYVKDASGKEMMRYQDSFRDIFQYVLENRKPHQYEEVITKEDFMKNFHIGAYYEQMKIVDPI